MNRLTAASVAAVLFVAASPALALTNDNGVIVFTQADAINGGVTAGDTPGFPVTISVGGSYRLGSNLAVTTAVNGIEVRANEVTIDMAGFTLAGSGVGRNGITSFNRSLRVANGNIRGFTLDGIRTIAQYLSVTDMLVTANGRRGINAEPQGNDNQTVAFARIASSTMTANGTTGINCGSHCRVENSLASGNGASGIYFNGIGGLALGNTATANRGLGIYFSAEGGAGNNTVLGNASGQIDGVYTAMQPNACDPACPPPP